MKNNSKFLIIVSAIIIAIFCTALIIKINIVDKLDAKAALIQRQWELLLTASTERMSIIDEYIKNYTGVASDLLLAVNKNSEHRDRYKEKLSEEFLMLENDVNEHLIETVEKQEYSEDNNTYIRMLAINAKALNNIIDDYNEAIREFNVYCSVFPNFIVARSSGYTRQKYFEMKYGERNNHLIPN